MFDYVFVFLKNKDGKFGGRWGNVLCGEGVWHIRPPEIILGAFFVFFSIEKQFEGNSGGKLGNILRGCRAGNTIAGA